MRSRHRTRFQWVTNMSALTICDIAKSSPVERVSNIFVVTHMTEECLLDEMDATVRM